MGDRTDVGRIRDGKATIILESSGKTLGGDYRRTPFAEAVLFRERYAVMKNTARVSRR